LDFRASGGRRQTASNCGRKNSQGTIAFSFTSGSDFASRAVSLLTESH